MADELAKNEIEISLKEVKAKVSNLTTKFRCLTKTSFNFNLCICMGNNKIGSTESILY